MYDLYTYIYICTYYHYFVCGGCGDSHTHTVYKISSLYARWCCWRSYISSTSAGRTDPDKSVEYYFNNATLPYNIILFYIISSTIVSDRSKLGTRIITLHVNTWRIYFIHIGTHIKSTGTGIYAPWTHRRREDKFNVLRTYFTMILILWRTSSLSSLL